jgi:hypothetical protein
MTTITDDNATIDKVCNVIHHGGTVIEMTHSLR